MAALVFYCSSRILKYIMHKIEAKIDAAAVTREHCPIYLKKAVPGSFFTYLLTVCVTPKNNDIKRSIKVLLAGLEPATFGS